MKDKTDKKKSLKPNTNHILLSGQGDWRNSRVCISKASILCSSILLQVTKYILFYTTFLFYCRNVTTTCENKIIDNTTSNMVYHEASVNINNTDNIHFISQGCSNKISDFFLENYQLWLTLTSGVFLLQLLIFMTAISRACFKQEKITKL